MKLYLYILTFLVILFTNASYADSQSPYTDEGKSKDAAFISECKKANMPVSKIDGGICFTGVIDEPNTEELLSAINKFPDYTLIINSVGGRVDLAIDIGKAIHLNEMRLLVNGLCFSSCANYLVPAAFKLAVWENSFIIMHGSLPREFFGYYNIYKSQPTGSQTRQDVPDNFDELYDKFPDFLTTEVVEESKYFAQIRQSEQYLHRYWEVLRNLRVYGEAKCIPKTGFELIVGPKYLSEFVLTNHDFIWWPDRAEVLETVSKLRGNSVITLDMDLMPSWVPELGVVSQEECLKAFEQTK